MTPASCEEEDVWWVSVLKTGDKNRRIIVRSLSGFLNFLVYHIIFSNWWGQVAIEPNPHDKKSKWRTSDWQYYMSDEQRLISLFFSYHLEGFNRASLLFSASFFIPSFFALKTFLVVSPSLPHILPKVKLFHNDHTLLSLLIIWLFYSSGIFTAISVYDSSPGGIITGLFVFLIALGFCSAAAMDLILLSKVTFISSIFYNFTWFAVSVSWHNNSKSFVYLTKDEKYASPIVTL